MEDALTRLDLAITLAMSEYVLASPEDFNRMRNRLAASVSLEGQRTARELLHDEPGYAEFIKLLRAFEAPGELCSLWTHPAFISPAVAALAQFWDRMISPDGDSIFTLEVEDAEDESLYGYRLKSLTIAAYSVGEGGSWQLRNLTEADRLRASTMLTGAATFYLCNEEWMRFAPFYLINEAKRLAPADAWGDVVRGGSSAFISVGHGTESLASDSP